jgi:hypothetical protein
VIPFWILDFRFSIGRSPGKKVFCLPLCAMLLALSFAVEAQQPKKRLCVRDWQRLEPGSLR